MTDDPLWPRAATWLAQPDLRDEPVDMAVIGVPTWRTSLSPTRADTTPAAVRDALRRYSTWATSTGTDVSALHAVDRGDVRDPDGPDGESRVRSAVTAARTRLLVALGGDNSMTFPVAQGLGATGLVTLDAHHDLRDGASNGSPVRRLIEAGLSGRRVVQVGIADFANSAAYAARARDLGITVIPRDDLVGRPMADVMTEALEVASGNSRGRVHVDLDVDVCDRTVAPACPASLPGGLSASELRAAARSAGAHPAVVGLDLAEVDATADSPDGRTVRLAALCVLEAAAGLAARGS
jgi:formiminoglutamase